MAGGMLLTALGMRKKTKKSPPMRNQAVLGVGEGYFRVALTGLLAACVLAILAVAMGVSKGMFKFRFDRCDCLLTSSNPASVEAGASCVFDDDYIGVNIGWKSFVIEDAVSREGCLDGWEGTKDIGTPFGDGIYKKKTTTYGNGATGAADACVGLFIVSAIVSIVMYKTVQMSFVGPGSIYTIGLHNIALMCLLLSIASAISTASFWGRIQGKLGSLENSLAVTLYKATLDVCERDWDEVGDTDFCVTAPWTFEVPLFAGWLAISHVAVLFLTSVWILRKSAFVEGVLDGSIMTDGKAVVPRAVEYEQAVGRALATTEDPDYDVQDNKLYTGEQNIMVRPYPLPGSVKRAPKAAEALLSPLRNMSTPDGIGASPSPSTNRSSGTSNQSSITPRMLTGGFGLGLHGSPKAGPSSPGPVAPLPKPGTVKKDETKALSKAENKRIAKKAAKQQGGEEGGQGVGDELDKGGSGHGRSSSRPSLPKLPSLGSVGFRRKGADPEVDPLPRSKGSAGHSQKKSGMDLSFVQDLRAAPDGGNSDDNQNAAASDDDDDDDDSCASVIVLSKKGNNNDDDGGGDDEQEGTASRREKTRSEIDWTRIMAASSADDDTSGGGNGFDGGMGGVSDTGSSPLAGLLRGVSSMDQLPSMRDGLGLGAITEDPREDAMSEVTITPRAKSDRTTTHFEV